jgi:hypothetical protein
MDVESLERRTEKEYKEKGKKYETAFLAAQVKHLYEQGIAGIRGSFVAAVIMTIFLWDYISHTHLIIWLVCYACACAVGEVLFAAIQRDGSIEKNASKWGTRFAALSIVGGLLWGITPITMMPTDSV